tara:strand:- start:2027 stop:2212 length:186 start_codon:yes stop_codon:yes gene_type:complete
MKLRATIEFDLKANDLMDAHKQLKILEEDLKPLEKKWGKLIVNVKERRVVRKAEIADVSSE